MTKLEALNTTINLADGQSELVRKMNVILLRKGKKTVSQPQVSFWVRKSKQIPAEFAQEASEAIGHKVSPQQLRPDVFGGAQ